MRQTETKSQFGGSNRAFVAKKGGKNTKIGFQWGTANIHFF